MSVTLHLFLGQASVYPSLLVCIYISTNVSVRFFLLHVYLFVLWIFFFTAHSSAEIGNTMMTPWPREWCTSSLGVWVWPGSPRVPPGGVFDPRFVLHLSRGRCFLRFFFMRLCPRPPFIMKMYDILLTQEQVLETSYVELTTLVYLGAWAEL